MFAFLFNVAHVEDEAGTTRTVVVIAANAVDAESAIDGLFPSDHNITPVDISALDNVAEQRGYQAIGLTPTGDPWPDDSTE